MCKSSLIIGLLFFAFFSCSTNENRQNTSESCTILSAYNENVRQVVDSQLLDNDIVFCEPDSIRLVFLQSEEGIGFVRPSMIAIEDDTIIVIDRNTNVIATFDNQGKFIRKIGGIGRSDREYGNIGAAWINKCRILVSDWSKGTLISYGIDGRHIQSRRLDSKVLGAFAVLNDSTILHMKSPNEHESYRLEWLTKDGDVKAIAIPTDKFSNEIAGIIQPFNDTTVIATFPSNDTIFSVSNGKVEALQTMGIFYGKDSDCSYFPQLATPFGLKGDNWLISWQNAHRSYISLVRDGNRKDYLRGDANSNILYTPFVPISPITDKCIAGIVDPSCFDFLKLESLNKWKSLICDYNMDFDNVRSGDTFLVLIYL